MENIKAIIKDKKTSGYNIIVNEKPTLYYHKYKIKGAELWIGFDKTRLFCNTYYKDEYHGARAFGGSAMTINLVGGGTRTLKNIWWHGGQKLTEEYFRIVTIPVGVCVLNEALKGNTITYAAYTADTQRLHLKALEIMTISNDEIYKLKELKK